MSCVLKGFRSLGAGLWARAAPALAKLEGGEVKVAVGEVDSPKLAETSSCLPCADAPVMSCAELIMCGLYWSCCVSKKDGMEGQHDFSMRGNRSTRKLPDQELLGCCWV